MIYSESQLIELAHKNPKELARILASPDVDNRTLTFGAEILGGEVFEEELVIPVLKKLLKHFNAMVREGAMMGVSSFFSNKRMPSDILDRLKVMASSDPSLGNREYAKDLISSFESNL